MARFVTPMHVVHEGSQMLHCRPVFDAVPIDAKLILDYG